MLRQPFGLYTTNPLREAKWLQQEINRLFENPLSHQSSRSTVDFPALNVWSNENDVFVTSELPGVAIDNIDISVTGDTLTLEGARMPFTESQKWNYHRRERRYGKFTRSIQLPFNVEASKVKAVFEKGVLKVSLPRAETEKPRKITVKIA